MDSIEVWLRAQLAEDERVARAATSGKWQWATLAGKPNLALVAGTWPGQTVVPSASPDVYPNRYDAEHIALYDPDRMLAEIAGKRAILGWHSDDAGDCSTCRPPFNTWPCATVRLLAAPYADRPGYRDEWAG